MSRRTLQELRIRSFAGFLILCLTIMCHDSLFSQYMIDVWTTAQGLPQNSVNTIIQTRDGYLWMGTYGGVVRFDGITFTKIGGESSGLQSDRIISLYESKDGGVWIGTEARGLAKYINGSFINYESEEGLAGASVFCLFEDRDSLLWMGMHNGVRCLKNGKSIIPPFGNVITTPVRSIVGTRTGNIWITADEGVYRYNHKTLVPVKSVGRAKKPIITFVYEDTDGGLWYHGPEGLLYENRGPIESVGMKNGLSHPFVNKMARDQDGVYWVGGLVSGIHYGTLIPKKKFTRLPLPDGKLNSKIQICFIDREGNRWIGTDGDGLVRIKDRLIEVIGASAGLRHDILEAVFEDSKGSLWIGTNNGGLYKESHGVFHEFTKRDGISPSSIWSITEDADGSIWAGSYGDGVWRYKNKVFKNFTKDDGLTHNSVLALYTDRDGNVWMGTERGGVTIYDHGVFRTLTQENGLSNLSVRTFHQDKTGAVWIGTLNGLNRYFNGKITVYTTTQGLSHNYIRSIYEDADSVLWFGTYGGGLNRYKGGVFTRYTIHEGLYDNVVSAILEDDQDNFWMSCNRGIFRVNRKQLNDFADGKLAQITSIAYGTEHGLVSDEMNGGFQPAAWRTKDGRLLFPSIKGLAVIPLSRIKTNINIPPVHIEKVFVNQVEYPLAPRIEIPYGRQQIEIHYSALNFTDPQHTMFKFWLEGVHGDWMNVKQRRVAYFSNLSSGEYNFHVIASNSDGVWTSEGASMVIVIRPPFWETWYFRIFTLLLICFMAYMIYLNKHRRRQRETLLQQRFAHQLLDSIEVERKRIAAELHDSIGQEILIIKNRALLALGDMKSKKNVKEQLNEISNTASQAIQEAREISYNLHPYQIDRLGLKKAIESILARASQTSPIVLTSDIDPIDSLIPKEMGIHVYRIIQECINNIIKHAKATTGRVTIKRWHERLNIDVEDNGIGFDIIDEEIEGKHGLGLHGIAERARLLGGKMRIESVPGKGTRILLTVQTHEETHTSN